MRGTITRLVSGQEVTLTAESGESFSCSHVDSSFSQEDRVAFFPVNGVVKRISEQHLFCQTDKAAKHFLLELRAGDYRSSA